MEFEMGVTDLRTKDNADSRFTDFVKMHIEGHAIQWTETNSPDGKFESAAVHHYRTCSECRKVNNGK